MPKPTDPFFVGWGKVPKALRFFLASVAGLLIISFAALSYGTAATQTDTGGGAFMGRVQVTGVLQVNPYPILHVIESPQFAPGDTILLSGNGKRGAFTQAEGLDGQVVEANGIRMDRGSLKGMQLRGGARGLKPAEDQTRGLDIDVEPLGRWRLQGEICDGKCLNGAMRPGTGLAHRACANLCLLGDIAPVFVSSGPIDGSEFLLMSNPDGVTVTPELLDYTAIFVEIEGDVERHGGMLVFKIAPETIKVVQ
ncbi:MAG: hypothetical protein AB8B71_02535 [Paracoccaceae bacterium]